VCQSAKGEKSTLNTSQAEGGVEDLNADDAFGTRHHATSVTFFYNCL